MKIDLERSYENAIAMIDNSDCDDVINISVGTTEKSQSLSNLSIAEVKALILVIDALKAKLK